MGGGTNTHKPLEYAKRYMFTRQRGDRDDKDDVCIVITDGQSYDPARTAQASESVSSEPAGWLHSADPCVSTILLVS